MPKHVTIKYSRTYEEYCVPAGNDPKDTREVNIYYTPDKQDAIDTAKHVHGQDAIIKIKSVK